MEPLYKGQGPYSGASLQGTRSIQWSLSTKDKVLCPLYSGASLQRTRSFVPHTVKPLYKGQVWDGSFVSYKDKLGTGPFVVPYTVESLSTREGPLSLVRGFNIRS